MNKIFTETEKEFFSVGDTIKVESSITEAQERVQKKIGKFCHTQVFPSADQKSFELIVREDIG